MASKSPKETAEAEGRSDTKTDRQRGTAKTGEDTLCAIHEAGHAVAMYRLGSSLGAVSIDRTKALGGFRNPEREIKNIKLDAPDGRAKLERYIMVLHAGNVAEQIHVPSVVTTLSRIDHDGVHTMLESQETDPAVLMTWCAYLWQRTYAMLLDPRQWNLVTVMAKALLAFTTISGKDATLLLKDQDDAPRKTDGDANMVAGGGEVVTPWHCQWLRRAATAKRETVVVDLSPHLRDVLKGLSSRAWKGLQIADIKTVEELSQWSRLALGRIINVGPKTIEEILRAVTEAGITLAPDDAPYPWTSGEERRYRDSASYSRLPRRESSV
jgi:hypothetical protein